MVRNVHPITSGQLWQLSDRRRLSIFRVLGQAVDGNGQARIFIRPIYPVAPGRSAVVAVPRYKFEQTGSKGYMRVR